MKYHLCDIDQHYKKLTKKNCTVYGASSSKPPWFQGVYHISFVQKIRFPCCLMPTVRHHWPLGDTGTCLCITNIKYSVVFFFFQPVHIAVVSKDGQIHIFEYSLNGWVAYISFLRFSWQWLVEPHSWQNASLHFGEKRTKPLSSNSLALREVWSVNCFLIFFFFHKFSSSLNCLII